MLSLFLNLFCSTQRIWKWTFSFFTTVTLKIRSRSPKPNQFFAISQLNTHEIFLRIQQLAHKILSKEENLTQTPTPTPTSKPMGSTPKSMCLPPLQWEDIMITWAMPCLWPYAHSECPDQPARPIRAFTANRIIGYYRMYEWRAKTWMILCACTGWSESVHFRYV